MDSTGNLPLFVYMIHYSIIGGWLPLLKRKENPYDGRMRSMLVLRFVAIISLQPLGHISYWLPVIIIGFRERSSILVG
jgi:ACS family hexuronate transporter-like MFS transporter